MGFIASTIIFEYSLQKPFSRNELSKPAFKERSAEVPVVAVSSDGQGVICKATVEIADGKGRVLFNTNPFVEPDMQYSIETAKNVAESFAKVSLSQKDVVYSVEAPKALLVGGPSAGAAICVATIAAIEGKSLRSNVAITGTIQSNGSIGHVGGILEKAQAAAENGFKYFLVPKGQKEVIFYERKESEQRGRGFLIKKVYYEPKKVDLNELMYEQYGMQVIEIENISQLASFVIVS
ncbi:MAG: hypothetical protein N3F05_03240 [Candidatus Diapherotrites archaeon]|nr:hypothetical protein [Candidatus Diapherotrites archaeon]